MISPADLSALKSSGFSPLKKGADKLPRLSVLTEGKSKTGKTHWALYTAPEPVAIIIMDPGSADIVQQAVNSGREILPRFINHSKKESWDQAKKLWQEYRTVLRSVMGARSIRTLVLDTATEVWELARLAEFGRLEKVMGYQYTGVNAEFGGLIDELYYSRPDLNTIYIQKLRKQYENDKWDGKTWESRGFGDLEYQVDLSLRHFFKERKFGFKITDSEATRFGPQWAGMKFEGDECSFLDLALNVFAEHPQGSDPEYWGIKL